MKYEIFGPFEIPRDGMLTSRDAKKRRAFWAGVDEAEECLSEACGCYLMTVRNKAWYVGLAEKQSFKNECFQPHKIVQYDSAMSHAKGVPQLLLLARMTPSGYFASPSRNGYADIQSLEQLLIGAAIDRNPLIRNVKDTKVLREMKVPGFLNSSRGQANFGAVKTFRAAIGV